MTRFAKPAKSTALPSRAQTALAPALAGGPAEVLELVATGAPLPEVLTALVVMIEGGGTGIRGSVLRLDETGRHLLFGAAPNLPASYNAAIDRLEIGPETGSCGSAAYHGKRVIVEDVMEDRRWAGFRHLAHKHGFRACWSQPIFSADGRVLGTFALYSPSPRGPTVAEMQLIDTAASLAAIAIEHDRAKSALHREQRLLQVLMDNVPHTIYFKDPDGRFTRVNRALAEYFGEAEPDDLVGKSDADYYAPEAAQEFREDELNIMRTGKPLIAKLEDNGATGDERLWFLTTKVPVRDETGQIAGIAGISHEVTERHHRHADLKVQVRERTNDLSDANERLKSEIIERLRAEERWRSFASTAVDHILIVDPDGVIQFLNRATEGYTIEEAIGQTVFDFVLPRYHEQYRETLARVTTTGASETIELMGAGPDRTTVWYSTRVGPFRQDGRIVGATLFATNISARKRVEEDARRRAEELSRVAQVSTMALMTASFSHSLSQPLQVIINRAESCLAQVRDGTIDPAQLETSLEAIVGQSQRFGGTMRRIRASVEQSAAPPMPTNINDVVRDVVGLLEPIARDADATIHLQLAEDLPNVRVDRLRLEQVLQNLGTNGIQAMAPVAGRRELTLSTRAGEGDTVEIRVTDTGPGVGEKETPQVFDPFFTTKTSGLGIGLPLSRLAISTHGGSLDLEPAETGGACFVVRLPQGGPPVEAFHRSQ